jgi:ABC-type sugar transport system ATPase subunit
MPRIEVHAVSSSYRGDGGACIPGVAALDLEVAAGEFLVVLGPSGSGKTTLLRLIAGLEAPGQGELRFDGERVNEVAAADRDVGMMFQTPALFPHLTVRENLALGLVLRGVARPIIQEAVASMARRLEIEPLLHRRPAQLSGGEQQRVALGRALIRQPRILLLDEPLSSLDAPLRRQLGEVIVRLHAESGTTTLLVTHDPREVPDPATRIVVLERGRIIQTGTLEELRAQPLSPFIAAL